MRRTENRAVLVLDSPRLIFVHELPAPYAPHRVGGWGELHGELKEAPPSTVVLLDPRDGGDAPSERVWELISRFPLIPVVVALELDPALTGDLRMLLEWGVSEVVNTRLEAHPGAVAYRLRVAHARPLKRRVEEVMPRSLSRNGLTLLHAAAEVAVDGGGAPELARLLGARPRTVAGWCEREGLPDPRRLQAWMRLFLAAALLEDPERTVVSAARACGYATDHSLRRAARELLGGKAPPRPDAFRATAEAFTAELREMREQARERRRVSSSSA